MVAETRRETPESQLLVDTVDIRRRVGTRREFAATTSLDDMVAGEFSVIDGRLDIDLVIEVITEGIVAKGRACGRWTGPCRRCLEPIVGSLEVEVHEIFERHPTDGETWPIEDERIDLAPVLREAALLSLPLAPLCRDECPGPAPDRFPTMVEADLDLTAAPRHRDPRWAALEDVHFDD